MNVSLTQVVAIQAILPSWEPVAWVAVVVFALAGVLAWRGQPKIERWFSTFGWLVLASVWIVMAPYFALEARSPIQTVLVIVAIPATVWAGLVRWRGREQLVVLGNAAAIAGLIYLPAYTIEPFRQWMIETVAVHTHWLMGLVGYTPGIVTGPGPGYMSQFDFDGHTTYIVMACTGLGSMAIFAGVILAVEGSLWRRLGATALLAGIIYGLNLIRNVFVGLATPLGWFGSDPFVSVAGLFGVESVRASFFVSHTLIAQPLSVVALVGLTLLAVRLVPELFTLFDEIVFLLTGDDVDLRSEFGPTLLGEEPTGMERLAD